MKMNKKNNISLIKSFKCAIKGVVCCIKTERNFRIHLCALFYVIWFSTFYNFTSTQKAVIAIAIGFVIVAEMLNTAIETDIDLTSPEYNRLAGLSKDIAAGAVLVSAVTSVAVGIFMFFDIEVLKKIALFYTSKPIRIVPLGLSAVAWILIIFLPVILDSKKKG